MTARDRKTAIAAMQDPAIEENVGFVGDLVTETWVITRLGQQAEREKSTNLEGLRTGDYSHCNDFARWFTP